MSNVASALNRIEQAQPDAEEIDIGENRTALNLLQAVYRRKDLSLNTRMRAASIAIPYESPKLAVTAVISDQDFAARLDQRLRRIAEMKVIKVEEGTEPKVIEGPKPAVAPTKRVTDPSLPFATLRRRV